MQCNDILVAPKTRKRNSGKQKKRNIYLFKFDIQFEAITSKLK